MAPRSCRGGLESFHGVCVLLTECCRHHGMHPTCRSRPLTEELPSSPLVHLHQAPSIPTSHHTLTQPSSSRTSHSSSSPPPPPLHLTPIQFPHSFSSCRQQNFDPAFLTSGSISAPQQRIVPHARRRALLLVCAYACASALWVGRGLVGVWEVRWLAGAGGARLR